MPYTATSWTNGTTPLSAANLSHGETQYSEATLSFEQDLFQPFVFSGLVATKDGTIVNQLDVTSGVAFLLQSSDNTLRRRAMSASTPGQFTTSAISATYYLDLNPDGTWSFATSHSAQANYLSIAQVTTDASGNISTVTDERVTTINLFSGALAAGMQINGNAVVTAAGGSLTLTNLTVTGSVAFSSAPVTTVTLSGGNKHIQEWKATDGDDWIWFFNSDNSISLFDNTTAKTATNWTRNGTTSAVAVEALGTMSFGGGNYSLIATASNGAIYSDNGSLKSTGSGTLKGGSFTPNNGNAGFNCRGNFSGTGSGTFSHGAGTTPSYVGITDNSSGGSMTVGVASYGATTCVVTVGASHAWLGLAV